MDFRSEIIAFLKHHGIDAPVEVPPDPELGDYAMPCFTLAKERKQAPPIIAKEIAAELGKKLPACIERVAAAGPYVNFFIATSARAKAVIDAIRAGSFWKLGGGKQRILIEYPSPNTNKPIHLGHVRNMVLGSTLALILKADGNTVFQVNLNNDRGVHICKSMLAYERFGDNEEPTKKSDHFVGDYYVLFQKKAKENPALEEEAQTMLRKWEENDPHVRALWTKMNKWAFDGFNATYDRYRIGFDKEYFESEIYQDGKTIVLENKEKLLTDESGAVIAPLSAYGLPDKVLLRKDGTSIYMTQDIALTARKLEEFHPDRQIWVVANEQQLHFQQLFAIMDLLGLGGKDTFFHFSYGMVSLPEGRMKSREGNVVDADDILDEVETLAREEIAKRHVDWDEERIAKTSKLVALGAIRFFMLKYDPLRDFVFDPKTSLSFEGDTGPYLQYTHARLCSILGKTELPMTADYALLCTPAEQELLRQLEILPLAARKAIDEYKLNTLATQLFETARAANSFYHSSPVLKEEEKLRDARLHLIDAARRAIDEGLQLLDIDAPEEM
jgi:arginyl-tRNA synthetase